MKSPHALDLSRLEKLREQMEAANGTSQRAHEQALEAYRKANALRMEWRNLEDRVSQNLQVMDSRELRSKVSELQAQELRETKEKERLFERYETVSERSKAMRALYSRCADFVGADSAR